MIFIDASNIFHIQSRVERSYEVDFQLLRNILSQGGKHFNEGFTDELDVVRVIVYTSAFEGELQGKKRRFIDKLRILGFVVRVLPLKRYKQKCSRCKGDDERVSETGKEVMMALDMLELAYRDAYDVAVLVTHDNDFCEVARRLMSTGRRVFVAGFSKHLTELRNSCDAVLDLEKVRENIRLTAEVR
jgi:uncharacterized LabA/DUF88 family protein